ncbi:UNVERIFIED_CONTAM: hypothetical protein FKN15_076600 [Acipenser sinensis]
MSLCMPDNSCDQRTVYASEKVIPEMGFNTIEVPAQPTNFKAEAKSETSILLSWVPPKGDSIIGYELVYKKGEQGEEQHVIFEPDTSYLLQGLKPFTNYFFRLAARSSYGQGAATTEISAETPQTQPSAPPQDIKCTSPSSTSILVSWLPPPVELQNGIITKYSIQYAAIEGEDTNPHHISDLYPEISQYLLEELEKWTEYRVTVSAHTEVGPGPESLPQLIRTDEDVPSGPPRKVEVEAVNSTSIKVTWRSPVPNKQHGQIRGYQVHYVKMDNGEPRGQPMIKDIMLADAQYAAIEGEDTNPHHISDLYPEISQYLLEELEKWTEYRVTVSAHTEVGPGPESLPQLIRTDEDVPSGPPRKVEVEAVNSTSIKVTWRSPVPNKQHGQIRGYQVHYVKMDNGEPRGQPMIKDIMLADAQTMYSTSPYSDPVVSADIDPQPIIDEEEGLIWVVGPVLAVVFIICIVIAILLFKRSISPLWKFVFLFFLAGGIVVSRSESAEAIARCSYICLLHLSVHYTTHLSIIILTGMASHPPIPIMELADQLERLKANDNLKFSQEYESIDPGQQFTWEHSNLEVNKPKNRYANVIAYDHSRVLLFAIEGIPGSDYVNSNYIDGYRKQNAYIATQGPLPETFGDFWRMIWEQRSANVVMMTKLEERSRVKCDQYWPTRGTETYGLIQVTLLDTVELATYCVRTFALYKNGSSEKREVRQFQFTAWPDHGVPEHPTPFLAFLRRVKACNPPDAGPMVVHCR